MLRQMTMRRQRRSERRIAHFENMTHGIAHSADLRKPQLVQPARFTRGERRATSTRGCREFRQRQALDSTALRNEGRPRTKVENSNILDSAGVGAIC